MKLIDKDALVAEIERRCNFFIQQSKKKITTDDSSCAIALHGLISFINILEVKEVNEVPATVMVNKYGNSFISSWSGLKEYDNFKEGEEIKILIPKK